MAQCALHWRDGSTGFTARYNCTLLVYYQTFGRIEQAIAREKQLKGWKRERKNELVQSMNPEWRDLAADWYEDRR